MTIAIKRQGRVHGARLALTLLAVTMLPALAAARAFRQPMRMEPASRLWVTGTSTVRSFVCQAPAFEAQVESTVPDAAAGILAGRQAVDSVRLTVAAAQMDCGNGTMNAHMKKALKSTAHGTIAFVVDRYSVTEGAPAATMTIEGRLTLGGVTKSIIVQAAVQGSGPAGLLVTGSHELDMRDYSLTPPTLMLGALKVAPRVNVRFDLLLTE